MIRNCEKYKIDKDPKQIEAIRLIIENTISLLEGGGRSGKTFIILYCIIVRCINYPGSTHLVARFRFAHAKQAICYQTMPKVLKLCGLTGKVHLNKSDWFYEFENSSTIWICGLDDKERTEKILGNEYATIFLNEASQISFEAFEIILTRLNVPIDLSVLGLVAKMIIDYNPPSIQHWGYKMFHQRKYPDGRKIPDNDFGKIKINPTDNSHLDKGYIDRISQLSIAKRKRFLEGEYSLDSGTLWKRSWFKYNDNLPESFWRIVIGVDPTGSVGGDEVGIIVVGQENEDSFWVLDDFSLHGTPKEWADEVAAAYKKWNADIVVAEKNYGGDMVKSTIEGSHKYINVKPVTSSRSKIVRAEPISAMYEHGKFTHRTLFNDMEDEMCIYKPGETESPNRMDAMVFAAIELTEEGISVLDAI